MPIHTHADYLCRPHHRLLTLRADAQYADGTSSLPGHCFNLRTLIDSFREYMHSLCQICVTWNYCLFSLQSHSRSLISEPPLFSLSHLTCHCSFHHLCSLLPD